MKLSEQLTGNSEQKLRVIVLPSVWAVGEKKPCVPVGAVAEMGETNAGVSPRRGCATPVELTREEQSVSSVERIRVKADARGWEKKADPPPTAKDDKSEKGADQDGKGKESVARHGGSSEVEVAFYRKYTEAMLRRYAVMSMESGRVPSMLGREMFRGKVTSYKVQGFDDAVILCCDVEACLKKLSAEEQRVIKRVAVQQYTHGEAAGMLGVSLRTCITRYSEAIDRLTRIFLKVKLLEPQKACQ